MSRKQVAVLLLAFLILLSGNSLINTFGQPAKASPTHQDQRLGDAAQSCAVADVKALLTKGVDANSRGLLRQTPLMLAAGAVCTEVLHLLLEKGVEINAKDSDGRTALIHLIDFGLKTGVERVVVKAQDAARDLVNKGADINAKNQEGITVLMYAVNSSNTTIIRMLLEKGAEIDAKTNEGDTALMLAARYPRHDIVEILLEKGPNINHSNAKGQTALMIASENPWGESVVPVLLAKGADVSAKDKAGNTALKIATKNGHSKIVAMLKKAGAKA